MGGAGRRAGVAELALAGAATSVQAACASLAGVPFLGRVDFAIEIQPMFEASCVSCHVAGSAFLDLSAPRAGRDLVGVPSPQASTWLRVSPGDPQRNLLRDKAQCTPPVVGGPLPPGGALSPFQRALIHDWILEGALLPGDDRLSVTGFESGRDPDPVPTR